MLPAGEYGIAHMGGWQERIPRAERLVAAARAAGVPIVFFQEMHRRSGVDFGRELDGAETAHCVEGDPGTELYPTLRPEDGEFHIVKRRYSWFIGTEFGIVLPGLRAPTPVPTGAPTHVSA